MSRLIEAEEAYRVLTDYYHHRTDAQHEALREALERVPSAPQWIPCSERLPEEGNDTLVFISHKDKNSEVDIGMYEVSCGERGWSDAYGFWWDFEEIIAWMPLPEPYKGVTE